MTVLSLLLCYWFVTPMLLCWFVPPVYVSYCDIVCATRCYCVIGLCHSVLLCYWYVPLGVIVLLVCATRCYCVISLCHSVLLLSVCATVIGRSTDAGHSGHDHAQRSGHQPAEDHLRGAGHSRRPGHSHGMQSHTLRSSPLCRQFIGCK